MFHVLSDEDRKAIIRALEDRATYTLDGLVAACAGHKRTHEQVKAEFHHKHLPKLADSGAIMWSHDSDTIKRGPKFQACLDALSTGDSGDSRGDGDTAI